MLNERLFPKAIATPPPGPLLVSYGGGVNSVAVLAWLAREGLRPAAIVMADPGSEWPATHAYRENVIGPWLAARNFPTVTLIDRVSEGAHVARAWRLETLREECLRHGSIPSVAYGKKKCSAKYKGDTQRWWIARQAWAKQEWDRGGKLVKVIGYDAGESSRVRKAFPNAWENDRFLPWYPLHAAELTREDCVDLILAAGLPAPPKSACTFCPNNTLSEWEKLRRDEPEMFEQAVEMSRNAFPAIESPRHVGLMRCNPAGKRQLHVWAEGGYGALAPVSDAEADEIDAHEEMPCECAL